MMEVEEWERVTTHHAVDQFLLLTFGPYRRALVFGVHRQHAAFLEIQKFADGYRFRYDFHADFSLAIVTAGSLLA